MELSFGAWADATAIGRGWDRLRPDGCVLWEHLVLDTLIAAGVEQATCVRETQD